MRKLLPILLSLVGLFFVGCGKASDSSGTKSPAKTKLSFITNVSADFWVYAEAGARAAEREFGDIEVIFRSGDGTTTKQKQIVDDLLAAGVEGVAISPTSATNQIRMINDWATDAHVICVDSDSPESNRITYLGTDNIAAGRQLGELAKEALPNGGKVMVFVGIKDQQNAIERFQGFKEATAGSGIEVIDLRTDGADAAKARANAEDTLTAHPDIAGLVGLWSYNAPACLEAVKAAGLVGKVQILSFDEAPKTLEAIDAGEIFGTVVQDPYTFGYDSMALLRALAVKDMSPTDAGVPDNKIIYVPTKVLRKGEGLAYKIQCDEWKASIEN
ncbi:MAG: substrate-binding domain-containing protein [Opitutaceae bacterium]|jgi:ribose transport system substrate-binding protein|nr:substrate-binding domain-containing protein [Opitutaceae bacterium]